MPSKKETLLLTLILLAATLLGCARAQDSAGEPWEISGGAAPTRTPFGPVPTAAPLLPDATATRPPSITPTPDAPHPVPDLRTEPDQYTIQPGDTLGQIAQRFNVSLEQLIAANTNTLPNPDVLEVGQVIYVPPPDPLNTGPGTKIIPNSELVYGPNTIDFNIASFVERKSGYLTNYLEEINGEFMNGAQIVERVAQNYSVSPRLLLAVLEYQSSWVTNIAPHEDTLDYPMGVYDPWRNGLYRQLSWAADKLNHGYYLWRVNGVAAWVLIDGSVIPVNPTINAGTAGVQHVFSLIYNRENWEKAISADGLLATFTGLFSYPFDLGYEPLLPPDLAQPAMQLPFEQGEVWAFTGGPHGGWDNGSAWAALDFAPPGDALGCVPNDEWVVAATDGFIVRAENGAVIQDLDGDGFEQTGWTILYMHVESRDRVRPGAYVKAGDRIGHPSCEGGLSTGTHLHIARKYNGEWIPADQPDLPFIMDGWVSQGTGELYDGYLVRDGKSIVAWNGRTEENEIQR